jgi:LacI family transcriptional regulator
MRQLIIQKALELGYRGQNPALMELMREMQLDEPKPPNKKWVSLITFKGGEVGTFWGQVINGMISGLVKNGLDLNICLISSFTHDDFRMPPNFNASISQGIITLGKFTEEHIHKIKSYDLPVVSIDTVASANEYRLLTDTVMMCNEQPIIEIVSHLIRNGHSKIGYVGEIGSGRNFRERWLGFRGGMERGGLGVTPEFCCLKQDTGDLTSEMIRQWVANTKTLPTALVCANDFTALNVVQALKERRLRVPHNVAVSGFDNAFESGLLNLTTVDSFKVELGEQAAAVLVTRLQFPHHPYVSVRMATKVILRESTGRKL